MLAGPADKSYGIHVAKLAGMPADLLKRADSILQVLEGKGNAKVPLERSAQGDSDAAAEPASENPAPAEQQATAAEQAVPIEEHGDEQLALFAEPEPPKQSTLSKKQQAVLKELGAFDLLSANPMSAMNLIFELQKKLK
jgi:DNA mismatch repair protein MutS